MKKGFLLAILSFFISTTIVCAPCDSSNVLVYEMATYSRFTASASYPIIKSACSTALIAGITAFMQKNFALPIKECVDSEGNSYGDCDNCFLRIDIKVLATKSSIVSMEAGMEDYGGGAHGFGFWEFASFEPATGKRLKLTDLMVNGDSSALMSAIKEHYFDPEEPSPFFETLESEPEKFTGDFAIENGLLCMSVMGLNYSDSIKVPLPLVKPYITEEWWNKIN